MWPSLHNLGTATDTSVSQERHQELLNVLYWWALLSLNPFGQHSEDTLLSVGNLFPHFSSRLWSWKHYASAKNHTLEEKALINQIPLQPAWFIFPWLLSFIFLIAILIFFREVKNYCYIFMEHFQKVYFLKSRKITLTFWSTKKEFPKHPQITCFRLLYLTTTHLKRILLIFIFSNKTQPCTWGGQCSHGTFSGKYLFFQKWEAHCTHLTWGEYFFVSFSIEKNTLYILNTCIVMLLT